MYAELPFAFSQIEMKLKIPLLPGKIVLIKIECLGVKEETSSMI
jgi:hypothetical protein